MKITRSIKQMQRLALKLKASKQKIGFVPTMGCLHDGHLSLVRLARKKADVVVMSIYVNPTQFGPREDFAKYPRPWLEDVAKARNAGVDFLFAPHDLYMGEHSTLISESALSSGRCGSSRPGHFDGVATVVAKLFNIVQPDIAVFGQKDAQQCDVIERMARDLNFPVKIIRAPIKRDARGLAMSSRNIYLKPNEYEAALDFPRVLKEASLHEFKSPEQRCSWAIAELSKTPSISVIYVEQVAGRLCAAIKIGTTRLIDNFEVKS